MATETSTVQRTYMEAFLAFLSKHPITASASATVYAWLAAKLDMILNIMFNVQLSGVMDIVVEIFKMISVIGGAGVTALVLGIKYIEFREKLDARVKKKRRRNG